MPDEFSRFMKIASSLPASACEVSFNNLRGSSSATLRLRRAGVIAFISRWDSGPAHLRQDLKAAQAEIRDLDTALKDALVREGDLKEQLNAERARRKPITAEDVRAYLREQIAGALQTYKLEITVDAPSAPTSDQIDTDTGGAPRTIAEAAPGQPKPYRVPPVVKPGDALAAGWIYSDLDSDDPGLLHMSTGGQAAWVQVDSYGWYRTRLYGAQAEGGLEPLERSTMYPVAYVGTERAGVRERYEAAPKVPPATSADEGFRPGWIYDCPDDCRLVYIPAAPGRVYWLRYTSGSWFYEGDPGSSAPKARTRGFRPVAWVGDVDQPEALAAAKELGL